MFLIISLVLLVFSLLSFYLRKSVHLLGFYLIIEFGAFIVSMLSTILLYVMRESLINDVIDFNKDWDGPKKDEMKKVLNENIQNVFIAMLFFTVVLVSRILLAIYSWEHSFLEFATGHQSRDAPRTSKINLSMISRKKRETHRSMRPKPEMLQREQKWSRNILNLQSTRNEEEKLL